MNSRIYLLAMGLLGMLAVGCVPDNAPLPPPDLPVSPKMQPSYPASYAKPLPSQNPYNVPPPAFDDQPLVDQRLPEEAWFVDMYNKVGRPRISVVVYGAPGQSTTAQIENLMADWLSSSGQVTIISHGPGAAPPESASDILIQVQANQTQRDLVVIAEAINVHGGESIARANVQIPMPTDKIQLNNYTRFLVRKLIHGMVGTWTGTPPASTQPANP